MISNQILQNTIEGLKGISGVDFIVLDTDGNAVARTSGSEFDYVPDIKTFLVGNHQSLHLKSSHLTHKIGIVSGTDHHHNVLR